ncbi:MAG TPA: hypothetical protein VGQ91_03100, partial [Ideonella sp.]|nr:hypothetical protein [Ideonella sp.]
MALSPVFAKAGAASAAAGETADAPPPAASASTVRGPKSVPAGLVAMGRLAFAFRSGDEPDQGFAALARQRDLFDGVAVGVPWDLLQPAPDRLDTSVIDRALAEVARYNGAARKPLWIRLRVFASHRAPAWAKKLDGEPVEVRTPHHEQPLLLGRFWASNYRQAWRRLQEQLAARYDAHP